MDFQALIDSMNESQAKDRSNYHLTYGNLVKVLKAAPADAVFDERVKGIGSWRGSYIEIALFTDESGTHYEDEEYTGSYGPDYHKWAEQHQHGVKELPRNANELGALLESMIGKDFTGYKGGNFKIEEYKPLWLEQDGSTCAEVAVIGITEDLKLVTKDLEAVNE
jgi:hypothetical protein